MPENNNLASVCETISKSYEWCEGRTNYAGVRRRLFYTNRKNIVAYPTVPMENGRPKANGKLAGSFSLKEGKVFDFIEHNPDKAQATSEAQGEYPSQSCLEKLTAIYPGTDAEASSLAAVLHNTDNVYVIEDFEGRARVMGIEEMWRTKATVAMDFGQGAAGTAGTTIAIEASDLLPFAEYVGVLPTSEGEIDYSKNA